MRLIKLLSQGWAVELRAAQQVPIQFARLKSSRSIQGLGMITALGEVRALVIVFGIDRLPRKLPREEGALRKEYPVEYEQYSRRVRKLVPFVW